MLPFSPLFLELLILTHLLLQCPGRSDLFLAFNNKQLLFWFYILFVIKAWTPLTIILHVIIVIIIKIIQEVFLSAAILACVSSSKLSSSSLSQSSKFSRPFVIQSWRILVKTLDLFKELFAPVAFADLECLPHLVFTTRVFHSLHHGSCLIIGGLLFPLRNSCLANWKTLSILGDSNLKSFEPCQGQFFPKWIHSFGCDARHHSEQNCEAFLYLLKSVKLLYEG